MTDPLFAVPNAIEIVMALAYASGDCGRRHWRMIGARAFAVFGLCV
ncbi:MAG: hypothetical protein ABW164_06490 [Sphingobium sp.]